MEPVKITSKPIVYSALMAVIISLLFTGIFLNQKNNMKEELSAEKLQTQSLTQSRELLQKDIVDLESRIAMVTKSESDIQEKATSLSLTNAQLENEKSALSIKNKFIQGKINKLKQIEKELSELRLQNDKNSSQWNLEREKLQQTIAALEKDKQGLFTQLESRKTVAADYFRIEALRKKGNKQSRKASKTHRILVSFSWNDALTKEFTNSPVYLTLSGPGTSKMTSSASEKVLITMDKQSIEIPVVAQSKIQSVNKGRQEIIMTTKSRLLPGVYQADVYTDKYHLGGAQIKLD